MLILDDLIIAPTAVQAEANILAVAAQLGLPVTSWQPGGVARTIIKVLARVYAAFAAIIVIAIGGGFLDTAVGGWLTLLARNVYNVERILATAATGSQAITLTNTGGGLYIIEPADLTFSATIGGKKYLYRNTSGGTLNPLGTLDLDVQAVEVGSASNAAPGEITTLETTLLGVTCTNTAPVLGQDEETDEALRERCRLKPASLSPNGPKAAYEYVARSAVRLDGSSIGVNRVQIPTPPGDGSMTVYVAVPSGGVSGTVGDTSTDLGKIDDDIQKKVVPEGVGPVTVASAAEVEVPITYTVWIDSNANLSESEVKAAISDKLGAYFKTVPIGGHVISPASGKLYRNALIGAIERRVDGIDEIVSRHIIKAEIAAPSGDPDLAVGEVAKLGDITGSVVPV